MDDRDAWVVLHAPASRFCRAAKCDFLIIEKEVLVHAAKVVKHARIEQNAGTSNPVDGSRTKPPFGLVFPPIPWYQLLPGGPEQPWKLADRRLSRPIGIAEAEADDARRGVV